MPVAAAQAEQAINAMSGVVCAALDEHSHGSRCLPLTSRGSSAAFLCVSGCAGVAQLLLSLLSRRREGLAVRQHQFLFTPGVFRHRSAMHLNGIVTADKCHSTGLSDLCDVPAQHSLLA